MKEASLSRFACFAGAVAFTPPVAFFEARLEEEVLAQAVGLFDEGVAVLSVEDVIEYAIGFEEDRLWDNQIFVCAGDAPGVVVRSIGAAAAFGAGFVGGNLLQNVHDENLSDLGSAPCDIEHTRALGIGDWNADPVVVRAPSVLCVEKFCDEGSG